MNILKFSEFNSNENLAIVPGDSDKTTDAQILRTAIEAELDAINLYEQMSESAKSDKIKKTLLDISREEKVHIGELQALLLEIDEEQVDGLKDGKKEVE